MDDQKQTPSDQAVDWRESWGPAFQRVLLSIEAVDKFERGADPKK